MGSNPTLSATFFILYRKNSHLVAQASGGTYFGPNNTGCSLKRRSEVRLRKVDEGAIFEPQDDSAALEEPLLRLG